MAEREYTTIAVTPGDVERLNEIKTKHLDNESASYREVINYLVDEKETREDSFEEILAVALRDTDESDVYRAYERVKNDEEFVQELSEGDGE